MADLHIIGSGGVKVGGLGIIFTWTTPVSVVGSGGVSVGGTGVIAFITPGVTAVVGSGGVEINGTGIIDFISPPVQEVVSSGVLGIAGDGVIAETFPPIEEHIGSGELVVGGEGLVATTFPTATLLLEVVGSGGLSIGGAGVIDGSVPPILAVVGSGGIQVGNFRVPELSVVRVLFPASLASRAVRGSGGLELGGEGVIAFSAPPPVYAVPGPQDGAEANLKVGGAGIVAFIHPQILQVIGEGELLIGGEAMDMGPIETYVLTGARGEPSIYSGFNFNSYARFRDQYYGAGPDGIYLLGGDDDAGEEIHSGVRIGPTNFGTERQKLMRCLRCGGRTEGAQVKVTNESGFADYFDLEEGRASISRDVKGRELTVDIAGFETLDHFETVPHVLAKR